MSLRCSVGNWVIGVRLWLLCKQCYECWLGLSFVPIAKVKGEKRKKRKVDKKNKKQFGLAVCVMRLLIGPILKNFRVKVEIRNDISV